MTFKNDVAVSTCECLTTVVGRRRRGELAVMSLLTLLAIAGCSAWSREAPDTSRANFVRDPFRVWSAIELALIELEYRIEDSDELQGTVRGVSNTGGKGPEIVLNISQVARGSDQVSVYVKPSFSEAGGTGDPDLLEAAAAKFMKYLSDLLDG
jgi:hypothetical protein